MTTHADEQRSDEAVNCLPALAWAFLAIALVPHALALVGLDILAVIASTICFPASMGPLALVHAHLLVSRLGYTSHMAWISALLLSTTWSALVCWFWRKNRITALAVGASLFLLSVSWIWFTLIPLA